MTGAGSHSTADLSSSPGGSSGAGSVASGVTPLKIPRGGSQLPVAPGTPGTPGTGPGPAPVPHTPTGGPPPGSHAFETDLPQELLHQGWRKFWSRRENRPYFFNRMTGTTMWEMPPLNQQTSQPPNPPFHDPLGISGGGAGGHQHHHQQNNHLR